MNDTSLAKIDALGEALRIATDEHRPDLLLLGAGVDSALLAALWMYHGHDFQAITVGRGEGFDCDAHACLPYPCNSDLAWAEDVANTLGLKWTRIKLSVNEASHYLDRLMLQQRSFDLGQLNNIALLAALDRAGEFENFATGDDGDGLFGGYLNASTHLDWGAWIRERIPHIDPPVRSIGQALGKQPLLPYLDARVLDVVKQLTQDDIRVAVPVTEQPLPPGFMSQFDADEMAASERTWGKVILRKLAERYLPHRLAWRPKTDLEFGSGMCGLESVLAANSQNLQPGSEPATLRFYNDAHRGLYARFVELGGEIPPVNSGEYACPSCGGGVPIGKYHCHTCGYWQATS